MRKNSTKDERKSSSFSRLTVRAAIVIAIVFTVAVIFVGVAIGVFFALRTSGRMSMEERKNEANSDYVYDSGTVRFDGKTYRYNDDLTTFLFLGVDSGRELEGQPNKDLKPSPGQADVIFVLVLDEKNERVSIISIDRNTMSNFESYDGEGNLIGSVRNQLALAYSYGDGAHKSCELTRTAVSSFLYDIPLHAYYSMKYKAIAELNDAVGGVSVQIKDDLTSVDEALVMGETVKLTGKLAEKFLTARGGVGNETNEERLERQKEYLFAFIDAAIAALKKDWSLPADLYGRIKDNCYTDLTVGELVYLADLATRVDISYHSIAGETDRNSTFEEFNADDDALWRLILDIFYICEE
ncbi:MAG: hypothetical protein E7671_05110 [Ruminococcaceae bacterium]|nr:hypothetical protein [Oscillospiraceae bacterium]